MTNPVSFIVHPLGKEYSQNRQNVPSIGETIFLPPAWEEDVNDQGPYEVTNIVRKINGGKSWDDTTVNVHLK